MTPRRLLRRLLALFEARRLDKELDGEIAAHLELAERDARAAGLSPEEARAAARRAFGGVEGMKEAHRDARSVRWMDTLARDVRYGMTGLRRDPLFALVVIGVLALGIGGNAAMFSLLDAVLLKPLPFDAPERIVRIWEAPRPGATNATSTLDFLDWKRLGTSFDAVAAEDGGSMTLARDGDPVSLPASRVTADYFKVFAVAPLLGRTFAPGDDAPGATPVAVLSHAVWRTYFGADPAILNRPVLLDGLPRQVVGVLPPGVFDQGDAAVWVPLVFTPEQSDRDQHWLSVSARLRAGVTVSRGRDELRAMRASQAELIPAAARVWTIEVEPLDRLVVGDGLRQSLMIAGGAVLIVLLIACANVAGLLLARGTTRGQELAVRQALGASRGRLVGQLLAETLVLGLLGGAAGLALAWWTMRAAGPALRDVLPASAIVSVDARVLAFTLFAALTATLLAGVLPALQSTRSLAAGTHGSGRGSSAGRARVRGRRALVVAEVAMSVVLLCGAMLLFTTLRNLLRLDPGARIDGIVTASIDLPPRGYPTAERAAQFESAFTEHLQAMPAIARAGLATVLPMRWIGNGEGLFVSGVDEPIRVRLKRVDAGYFDALDIPMVAGRGITPADRSGAPPVVVVNQALAARLADVARMSAPVGQAVRISHIDFDRRLETSAEIVGVIRSERVDNPWRPDPPVVYVPLAQAPSAHLKLVVRSDAAAAVVVPAIRQALRAVDPALPLGDVTTMAEVRDRTFLPARRPASLIGAFAAIAALLTALGLYGVLAQSVTHQRREIGIRLALGAAPGRLVRQVVASALRLVALGSAAGLGAVVLLAPVLRSMVFRVSALDPSVLAGAVACMWTIGVAAALLPARRAARVDPVTVLRQ